MAKTRFVGELVFTMLLVLLTAGVVARREAGRGGDPISLPRPALGDWMRVNEAGIRFGPADAPWAITVFADLTCPFTRGLLVVLDSLARDRPDQVAVVFHHFLIGGRSLEVAVSVECADRFARAQELVRALGRRVEWNEPLDWALVARNAGLGDLTTFRQCLLLPADSFPRIGLGRTLGDTAGVVGTPTVWLNGTGFSGRTLAEFVRATSGSGVAEH